MNESTFQEALLASVRQGGAEDVRRAVAEGVAAGYSIDVPLTPFKTNQSYFRTALHDAVQYAAPPVTAALLELGASVSAKDSIGRTPLHWAVSYAEASNDRRVIVETLLHYGASGHSVSEGGSETVLHRAILSYGQVLGKQRISDRIKAAGLWADAEMLQLTRLLVAAGAEPDFVPERPKYDYLTAFQYAVHSGLDTQVRFFVEECGVDWSQETLSKKSMSQIAGTDEMRALLLSYKTGERVLGALGSGESSVHASAKMTGLAL